MCVCVIIFIYIAQGQPNMAKLLVGHRHCWGTSCEGCKVVTGITLVNHSKCSNLASWYTGTWTRGKQIDTQGHEEAFAEALEACDLLTRAPKEHLKCCSFVDIVDFDFRPIHEACEDVREHARDPHSSKLYNVTLRAARMCHDNIYPNFKNGMEFGFQNSLEIFATAAPMAQHMAQSVSIAMGFVQGLRGFNATWLGQVG